MLQVFRSYRSGSVDSTMQYVREITDRDYAEGMRKCLAVHALSEKRAEVLEQLLNEGGFAYENYFMDLLDKVRQEDGESETGRVVVAKWPRRGTNPRSILDDIA